MNSNENVRHYILSEKEKIAAFDRIAEHYFNRNFGTMAKADFEVLLFSIYIEHCLDAQIPFDDYTLSKQLGITQSRVRSLKLKKELTIPRKGFDWKQNFVEQIWTARYDEVKHLVKMNISDVNVLTELRHFMEDNGWFDEYQLNPKLFQCRLDIFICLCEKLGNDNSDFYRDIQDKKSELENILSDDKEKSALEKIFSGSLEEGIRELAVSLPKVGVILLLEKLPFGGLAKVAIDAILSVLK